MKRLGLAACAALFFNATAYAGDQSDTHGLAVELTRKYPLVDTHIDVPYRIHETWADVTRATADGEFDYPRARAGGLDVPFMSIYTPAELEHSGGSFQRANELIDSVEALVGRAPDRFTMVYSVRDAEAAFKQGKIGLALGMENGSPIEGKLANVAYFAKRGIRYITLAHSGSNHISDSSFDRARPNGGLSDFGREVVREMNRLGVMVDISHLSDEAIRDVLEVSQAPVIASHSSARHLTPGFERNISDELIEAVAAKGGVVMINFGSLFVTAEGSEYQMRLRSERAEFLEANAYSEDGVEASAWLMEFRAANPLPFATLSQVADHFDHVVELVGAAHVGIGSDFDGVGDSLPVGLKDVSTYPNLVAELLRRGYSEADLAGILGGNLLRVWRANEAYSGSR